MTRWYSAVVPLRGHTTVLVEAETAAEAKALIDDGEFEAVETNVYWTGKAQHVRVDRAAEDSRDE